MSQSFLTNLVERFAQAPERLSPDEREMVRSLMDQFPALARRVRDLVSFHLEAEMVPTPSESALDSFLDRVFRPLSVIQLVPMVFSIPPSAVLLAADTGTEQKPAVRTVSTLVSEVRKIVLRIQENRAKDTIDLFLLTPEDLPRSYAIVEFTDLNTVILLDPKGRASVPLEEFSALSSSSLTAHLRLPILEYTVTGQEPDSLLLHFDTELTAKGGELRLTRSSTGWTASQTSPSEAPLKHVVISGRNEKPALYEFAEGFASVGETAPRDVFRFYH